MFKNTLSVFNNSIQMPNC